MPQDEMVWLTVCGLLIARSNVSPLLAGAGMACSHRCGRPYRHARASAVAYSFAELG